MSAAELKSTPDSQPNFTPEVVILANDFERFNVFAEFLKKNGFPCQVFSTVEYSQFESSKPDTIFYVSFNFQGANPITLAHDLEQRLGMTCIVFAESDDFQTAAKLSSAKMTQTLQHPYTQKNFLMGLQTIVKKRKAEYEKEKRRQSHQRQELRQDTTPTDPGVIIQKGQAQVSSTSTIIQGETAAKVSVVQEGIKTETKVAVVAGEKTTSEIFLQHTDPLQRNSRQFESLPEEKVHQKYFNDNQKEFPKSHPLEVRSEHASVLVAEKSSDAKLPNQTHAPIALPKFEEEATAVSAQKEFDWEGLQKTMDQQFMDNKWAILGVSLFGILICCYCLYEMILMGR